MIDRHASPRDVYTRDTLHAIQHICESLNCSKSLGLYSVISSILDGTLSSNAQVEESLLDICELDPSAYLADDVESFAFNFCASSLVSKLPPVFEEGTEYLRERALLTFQETEQRLKALAEDALSGRLTCSSRDTLFISDLRKTLKSILGRAPSWSTVVELGGWGPGSSYGLNRDHASPELKCEYDNTVTHKLLTTLVEKGALDAFPYPKSWQLVPGNLIITVPKNFKTDRTIAIEPALNSWVQKGIGTVIRRRLKKLGIDLNDQTPNQLAAEAALALGFATLDLKAASDSICHEVMRLLLPSAWFELIDTARSARGSFSERKCQNKEWFEYAKTGSMGNGFTFELESALFYAILLASGVPASCAYVYGDDLIVPQMHVATVSAALGTYGFTLNKEKSFSTGLFYESCGLYSFHGVDVTPIKCKEFLHGSKDVIVLANKVRVFSGLSSGGMYSDRRFLPAWRHILSRLDPDVRPLLRGPIGSGLTVYCTLRESPWARYSRGAFHFYQAEPFIRDEDIEEGDFYTLLRYRIGQLSARLESSIYDASVPSYGNVVKQHFRGGYTLPSLDRRSKKSKGSSKVKRPRPNARVEQWTSPGEWHSHSFA